MSNFTYGKSPRLLHLGLQFAAEAYWFEVAATGRFSVSRRMGKLTQALKSEGYRGALEGGLVVAVVQEQTLAGGDSGAQHEIGDRDRGAGRGAFISELYLAVEDGELSIDQSYEILLRAVMRNDDYMDSTRRRQAQSCLDELLAI